jgi:hypothetical protein
MTPYPLILDVLPAPEVLGAGAIVLLILLGLLAVVVWRAIARAWRSRRNTREPD